MVYELEDHFVDSPPKISCVSTSVTKAIPKDVIIHTVRLQHKGYEWVSSLPLCISSSISLIPPFSVYNNNEN
jgi:hypothetical protein